MAGRRDNGPVVPQSQVPWRPVPNIEEDALSCGPTDESLDDEQLWRVTSQLIRQMLDLLAASSLPAANMTLSLKLSKSSTSTLLLSSPNERDQAQTIERAHPILNNIAVAADRKRAASPTIDSLVEG